MAAGDSADGESPTKSTQIGPIIPKVFSYFIFLPVKKPVKFFLHSKLFSRL